MKITDFIKENSQERKLKRVRECSTKEERRIIEEKLMIPEKLQQYTQEKTVSKSSVEDKTITLVFANEKEVKLFEKYFKVSYYKGANVRSQNLEMLINFLESLNRKELEYDRERGKFYCPGSNEMGERKQRIETKRECRNIR